MALDNKEKYQISNSDFELVQSTEKIFDKALDTKPTTYAKDALKRFAKNKSSIVGAIIIGILVLLAIIIPWVSPYNIDDKKPSTPEMLMPPKLFPAGTGFWDGLQEVTRKPYDKNTGLPLDIKSAAAVSNLKVDSQSTLINTATKGGFNGNIMFENTNVGKGATDVYLYSYNINFTDSNDYKVTYTLEQTNGIYDGQLGEYAVYLTTASDVKLDTVTTITSLNKEILLKDWSKDYGTQELNISAALQANGYTTFEGSLAFVIRKHNGTNAEYILIKECVISATNLTEEQQTIIDSVSFKDANQMALINDVDSQSYWRCNGRKGIYAAEIILCDYTYDKYEEVYGLKNTVIAMSDVDTYVKKGWFTYSYDTETKKITYEVLDDRCPIVEVNEITEANINPITKKLKDISCKVYKYKDYGYKTMPSFIFGTTDKGHDLVTKAFAGLRTSLILGVCTAAFCFIFGLCWGSISGYFGGTVDLFMERFMELLSGVPTTVILTLAILHLGNNFLTFVMALCLTGWMGTASRTRTQFYRFKGREYVLASRTLGSSDLRLIFKHVLPNSMGTIVTGSVLMITSVIFSEASIAYLNLGLQGVNSFGVMMSNNQKYLESAPSLVLFPAVIISLLMISFNLFGNGLRDALNPTLKGSE